MLFILLFGSVVELLQDSFQFCGNRQAEISCVFNKGNAFVGKIEEDDCGAQNRAGPDDHRVKNVSHTDKDKNEYLFEDALVKQMNIALSKVEGEFEVKKEQGRIYVFCPEQYDYDETVEALQHVFGIVGICPVVIYEDQGFEQMAKDVVSYMKNCHPNYDGSFKVYTRRAKKSYPITSMEVSAELGGRILDEIPDASVDVHEPDLTLSVEIRDKIYVYSQTIKGAGGMPIGTNGKAMLLLSGGIDSPVAGYMIAKRGVKIDADRKSTRLNSSHPSRSRKPSSA